MNTKTKKLSTVSMVLCGMFAALVAIGAFIQIPVPYMDYFTLQFFFVLLAGLILGADKGAISVCITGTCRSTNLCSRRRNRIHIPAKLWLSGRIHCKRICNRKSMRKAESKLQELSACLSCRICCDICNRNRV